jgi:hypothetical protein
MYTNKVKKIAAVHDLSAYFVQNGQTAVAGVEYTDGTG